MEKNIIMKRRICPLMMSHNHNEIYLVNMLINTKWHKNSFNGCSGSKVKGVASCLETFHSAKSHTLGTNQKGWSGDLVVHWRSGLVLKVF